MKNSNKIKIYRNKFLFLPTYVGCKIKWLTWVTTSELRSIVHNNKEIVYNKRIVCLGKKADRFKSVARHNHNINTL